MVTVASTERELAEYILSNPSHRVWGYVRVSSKKQEDGQSIEGQQQAIEEYCATHKLGTPAFVHEVGSATKPLFNVDLSKITKKKNKAEDVDDARPLFLQLLAHITQLDTAHLVVWKLDRFARSDEQEIIMNLLRKENTKLHSTFAGEANIIDDGGNDPARKMMRQIFSAVAQYEAGMIKIRMEMGRRHKGSVGGYTGGRPPFGYRAVAKELVIDRYEAELVRIIHKLRSSHAFTQQAITNYLNTKKSEDAPEITQQKVSRVLGEAFTRLYNGYYTDPYYGTETFREELVIIPEEKNDVE